MPLSTEHYGYIVDPFFSFMDDKGKTIKNGFLRVFLAGSSTPSVTYLNWNGAMNQETIQLDNSGRCYTRVIGAKDTLYKVCVYDSHHSQETPIITVDNVQVLGTITDILDESVTTAKIADEAVTTEKLHENAVTTLKISDEAVTTAKLENKSVTENKLTDELKLKVINDYVTPEMFGAKGDGVTDDTEAFTAMIAASNSYLLLSKTYKVTGITINKQFTLVGLPNASLSAVSKEQDYILRVDVSNRFIIRGINFSGLGSVEDRGNVVGVLFNNNSTYEAIIERCNFTNCKIGLFAPKTFWHSRLDMCEFFRCGTGLSVGEDEGSSSNVFLELTFNQCYWNQCDTHVYLDYGSEFTFNHCSFGSEALTNGSIFFKNRFALRNISFRYCNFERLFVKNNLGAFHIRDNANLIFDSCYIDHIAPAIGVDANNTCILRPDTVEGSMEIIFSRCFFASNTVSYAFYIPFGATKRIKFDWFSLNYLKSSLPSKVNAKDVYPGSTHIFSVSDVPKLESLPSSTPWASGLNNFFKGTKVCINKTNDTYEWDGSAWTKLVYVPQPVSDANTYTLKNVAGTLTWVQDS